MALTPNHKKKARELLAKYCERAEANKSDIHYKQFRPMNHLGKSPESEFTCDCSSFYTGAFYWADLQAKRNRLGFRLRDPNHLNYSGYGYTGTLLSANHKNRVPLDRVFWVGDMALFGPSLGDTRHVIICRKTGRRGEAIWSSHGNEAGPYPVNLDYRSDLLVVLRPYDLK